MSLTGRSIGLILSATPTETETVVAVLFRVVLERLREGCLFSSSTSFDFQPGQSSHAYVVGVGWLNHPYSCSF